MQTMQPILDEPQSLRRCVRELAALSALSAAWSQSEPREIADGLANVLCRILPVSFAYVRVNKQAGKVALEVARTHRGPAPVGQVHEISKTLDPLLEAGVHDQPVSMANPFGSGTLQLAIIPIGCEADCGILVAGSPQADFPGQTDRLLLSVAANQAAVVLQRQQAEETVRRSERELADFFDNAAIGLHWVGPDGTILRANRAELNLLGYSADEYIGHHIAEFHADSDRIEDILGRLRTGEELHEYEARMRCKDGSIKHVLINSNVLWENGQFIHTRCFTRDITDRKQAEEASRKSEERYRRLVALLPVAVYTCESPSGIITFYNDHAAALWGRTPPIGDTDERFCGSFKLWWPDGTFLPHQETPMAVALREGRPFRNQEVVIERPDGTRITVLVNIDPVRDADGRVVGAVNVFHDTTALKQAEQALRDSERRFREMIDALPAAIYTTDAEGRLTHFNPACIELSGRVPELGTNKWCVTWKLYYPDGRPMPHDECPMAVALKEGRDMRGAEAIAERLENTRIWFAAYPTPLRDPEGRVIGGINMLVDITERKRMEEALRESEERFRSLTTAITSVVWTTDVTGQFVVPQPPWAAYTGQTWEEYSGFGWLNALHPEDRESVQTLWEQARDARTLYKSAGRLWHAATRTYRHFEARGVPIVNPDGAMREWVGKCLDVEDRWQAEQRLATQDAVTRALAESATLNEAAAKILKTICEHLEWQMGALWYVDRQEKVLRCAEVYYSPSVQIPRFEAICRQRTFEPGIGLPGRIWTSGKAAWIADVVKDSNFPRAPFAAAEGLHGAFGLPILLNDEVLGVLEFFSDEIRQPNDDLLQMMTAVGSQIGQYIERTQAEEDLRESEQRFRLVAETIPSIVWTAAPDGTITYANENWFRYCGLTSEQNARNWPEIVLHPDDRERCMAQWWRSLREGTDYEVEVRNRARDGSYRWFVTRAVPLRDAIGRVVQWFGTTTDIDDRKRIEDTNRFLADASAALAELTDCESTLQRVAGLAVPFFADWCAVDLLEGTGSLRRLAVTHVDEAKVRLAHELHRRYPPRLDEPHGVMQVLRTGQSDWAPAITDELIAEAARDEEHLRIIRELGLTSYLCVPLRSAGKTLAVLTFVTAESRRAFTAHDLLVAEDLADRAAIAIDNARLYDRLRLLWEAAAVLLTAADPDAMLRELFARIGPHLGLDTYFHYMLDESGNALRLESCIGIPDQTARSITRLEFGQAICGTVAEQRQPVHATHIQQSDDPKAQLVKSFGIHAYVCNPLLSGEQLLGTLSFASRTRDQFDADELAFLETICRYVTVAYERLRLLDDLREADHRKDEFLATLAHELRNPLAPVRNAVQLLRLQGPDKPELRWGREVIDRQVSHLTRLIDDLLDISRITRGKLELRKARVELADVIQGAVETSRPVIEQCGHELTVTLPPEPVYLSADLVRLAQVFMNLLTNAAKYTDRGGLIWLTAERQGQEVVVRVKDTGVGIPAEKLPRLFEMFFQVDHSLERSQGGLGIGLSLVRRLVELHGGSVRARSAGAGKGSEFIVRLPVLAETPNPLSTHEPTDDGAMSARAARRILVADDMRDSAESLAMLLRLDGNEVQTAYDGLAAVEAAEQFRPEVVLLDIGMPKLNGYDACRRIREESWGKNAFLIALTGWGQEEDRRRTEEAGFGAHLVKPVDLTTLTKLLASLPTTVGQLTLK